MVYRDEDYSSDYWDGAIASDVEMVNSILSKSREVYDTYEWMQYTGLTDKNGQEIYEGDILKSEKYGNGEVKWENGVGFGCEFEEIRLGTGVWHMGEYEVIGNIYEDPELLE